MGIVTAIFYSLLIVAGYAHQIKKLYQTRDTKSISLPFFVLAWSALVLRIATVGFVIFETRNATAMVMGLAEILIFLGLSTTILQIVWYRRQERHSSRA